MRSINNGAIAAVCICAFCIPGLTAQAFDVASIKPTDPASHGGRFLASDGRFEVPRRPAWLEFPEKSMEERFDILAKGDASANPERVRLMVQTLLADRFQLKLYRETKELPAYALVVGKGGPKLQEAKSGSDQSLRMFPDGLVGRGASMDDDPNSPSLFTAIQDQLGPRLEPAKKPIEVLIVDSCSKRPSEN